MNSYFNARGANRLAIMLAVVVLALAGLVGWFAHDENLRTGYVVAAALVIVAILIPQAIKVADQWERAVVLRLGKLSAIRGPGIFFIVPFIDEVASWLDQRIQTTEINAEKALSKDTVPVNIDAVIFWQIHDPQRAALEITELPAGHHPGRADLAAGSGRLVPAVDAVVRAQAGRPDSARRDRAQDHVVGVHVQLADEQVQHVVGDGGRPPPAAPAARTGAGPAPVRGPAAGPRRGRRRPRARRCGSPGTGGAR